MRGLFFAALARTGRFGRVGASTCVTVLRNVMRAWDACCPAVGIIFSNGTVMRQSDKTMQDPGPRSPRDPRSAASSASTAPTAGAASVRRPLPGERVGGPARVEFEGPGQATWDWSVRTGMFDHRNVSTVRVRALLDTPFELMTGASAARGTPSAGPVPADASGRPAAGAAGGPAAVPAGRKPAAAQRVQPPQLRPGESPGGDPYSRGPARTPETVSFNPYERGATRRR